MNRAMKCVAVAAAVLAGCGGDAQLVGVAKMSLNHVPGNVQCISLEAAGSRTVQQTFDVVPSQSATLTFHGVPTGAVTFSGKAYNAACTAIAGASPTWTSDPSTVQVIAGTPADVHLIFHPAGDATISIDFADDNGPVCVPQMWTNHDKYVASRITLPQQRSDFSYDLNGDGRTDNQYGNLIGAVTSQGVSIQGAVDAAVANGSDLLLIDVGSNVKQLDCAGAIVQAGLPTMAPPRYDGTDSFTVDSQVAAGSFTGPITNAAFVSADPATMTTPATVSVLLPVFGNEFVRVPLVGARLMVVQGGPGMSFGQLNGAIRDSDVQKLVVPAFAHGMNTAIAADPNSSSSKQLLAIFDNGGTVNPMSMCPTTCANPDGTCAVQGDGVISICEVGSNGIIKNVLAPDVQLFAADGSYHPNPANAARDSLSVGIYLDLASASF
jgi:hypothetical protein